MQPKSVNKFNTNTKVKQQIFQTQAHVFEDVALFYSAAGHAVTNMKNTLF